MSSFVGGASSAIIAIALSPLIGPIFAGAIAGAANGAITAGLSGGNIGRGALFGAGFGLATGALGFGASEMFGNVGRQIFDSSVVIASGAIGISQGGLEGFAGGILGSGLVTGIASGFQNPSAMQSQPEPQGFWDTVWDVASFAYSAKQFNDSPSWGNFFGLAADTLALLAPGVPATVGGVRMLSNGDDIIRVRHYTNRAGKEAIEQAGKLSRNSFVTKVDAFPKGTRATTIESKLGIAPGKGKYHFDLNVNQSDLYVPGAKHGGEATRGGEWQRRLNRSYEIE